MEEIEEMVKKLSTGKSAAQRLQTKDSYLIVDTINERLREMKRLLGAPEDEAVDEQFQKSCKFQYTWLITTLISIFFSVQQEAAESI